MISKGQPNGVQFYKRRLEMKKATVTVLEASELFGISTTTIYRLIKAGKLPVIKLGRKKLISKQYLEALISEGNELRRGSND